MMTRIGLSVGRRRGMALMVVVGAIAVASLLGLAMLSSSALQAKMGGSIEHAAQADYLAESGVHYAVHQLRKTAASDQVYAGGTHTFGGDGRERFVVTVTRRPGSFQYYDITARGELLGSSGEVVASKTAGASVKATAHLKYDRAATFGADEVRLESGKINIDSVAAKRVIVGGSTFITNLLAQWIGGQQTNIGDSKLIPEFPYRMTPLSAVRTFHDAPYRYKDGNYYWARSVPSELYGVTLGPTSDNPAGIYYSAGSCRLNGNVTIRGTLVVVNGDLILGTLNNHIDGTGPQSAGFPALVVRNGDIRPPPFAVGRCLDVEGAAWIGGNIGQSALGVLTELRFRGAVILPTGKISVKGVGLMGTVNISYDSANTDIPHLDRELLSDIEILDWTNP